MDEQRNYTGSAFWITLIVVVMTVGMSLIPGFQVGRASVKRVNILSDLIRQEEHPRLEEADLYFDTTFLAEGRAIEAAAAADSLAADSAGGRQAAEPEIRELVWDLPGYRPMPGHDRSGNEGTGIDSAALVAIEDFGGEVPAMEHFYRTMLEKDRRRPGPDRRSRRLVHRGRYRDGRCARADAGSVRRLRRRLRTFLVSDRAVQGYGAAYVRRLENLRRQGVPESARGRTGQVFRVGQRLHSPAGRDGAHGGRDFPPGISMRRAWRGFCLSIGATPRCTSWSTTRSSAISGPTRVLWRSRS